MTNSNMLIHLAAQAEARGSDLVTLRALIEEASDLGAARALARLGLSDDSAAKDMAELREAYERVEARQWDGYGPTHTSGGRSDGGE